MPSTVKFGISVSSFRAKKLSTVHKAGKIPLA
jgi:hypothetical protein